MRRNLYIKTQTKQNTKNIIHIRIIVKESDIFLMRSNSPELATIQPPTSYYHLQYLWPLFYLVKNPVHQLQEPVSPETDALHK